MNIHLPFYFRSEQVHKSYSHIDVVMCFLWDSLQILCIVDNMLMMVTLLLLAGLLLCIIGVPGLCLLYFKEFQQKWQMRRSWFVIWHEFQHLVTSHTLQSIKIPPSPYQSASGAMMDTIIEMITHLWIVLGSWWTRGLHFYPLCLWMLCCVLSVGCMHTLIVVSIYCRVTGDNWGCCSFHNGLLSVLISYQGGFIHYHIYPPWPVADNDTGTEDTELFHKLKLLPPPWSGFQYPPKQCSALGTVEQGFYYQEIYYPRCRHGPLRRFQLSQLRTPRGIV